MGLTDLKFKETDFTNRKISDLSDTPSSDGMTAEQLKAYFDYIPKAMIALGAINKIIDELCSTSGAGDVGASVTGVAGINVQDVLANLKGMIDNRYTKEAVDGLLQEKVSENTIASLIARVDFEEETGKFIFTEQCGTVHEFDTALEQVVTNWDYDVETQKLVLTLESGETKSIDLSAFITINEFLDSDSIGFSVSGEKVSANIKAGSVTDEMLQSSLLAAVRAYAENCAQEAQKAETAKMNAGQYADAAALSASAAAESAKSVENTVEETSQKANDAKASATLSQSYAQGGTGTRTGEDSSNARYYMEKAQEAAAQASGFDYQGEWSNTKSYTANQLVSYAYTLWAAKKNNVNSIPYEGSQDWTIFVGMPAVLDLGTFTDENLAVHIMNANAHSDMTLDANSPSATIQQTLYDHETSGQAHGNINIDGGGN